MCYGNLFRTEVFDDENNKVGLIEKYDQENTFFANFLNGKTFMYVGNYHSLEAAKHAVLRKYHNNNKVLVGT